MKRVAVVTTSRADYGIYRPVLRRLCAEPELHTMLMVSGSHLSTKHGLTVREIESDGFEIAARIPINLDTDAPGDVARAMAWTVAGFADHLAQLSPDLVMVLGDRFEMHAAAVATVPFNIPLAHLHGGEVTEGAIDDVFRHSLTKLSHLHFVATEDSARRVRQLGEEAWRVVVSGAPSLDALLQHEPMDVAQLSLRVGTELSERKYLLVTFHPVTREPDLAASQVAELVGALEEVAMPVVVTMPNADPGGLAVRDAMTAAVSRHSDWVCCESLGWDAYVAAMVHAAAMVGNSSSGIIEAPSLSLPVVNVGARQDGRVRGDNVIDVECKAADIARAIVQTLAPAMRARLTDKKNPYGDGHASECIAHNILSTALDQKLLRKRFVDVAMS